ncbi:KamA family protein [Dysgonomonas sp. PFB1-18]|uniref:KamA family radical SAM protein n=1 Tax=unclassified Dysgonomonas TaxID=2630389 RepID=UPI00247638AC|nr:MULTISPECIES: lysine 2,3-aminomutase [unclassified Dysgonomonas]MDH6310878.1 KamA family protein [Dysgonomonas sp. PF1-14]MDH6340684.1 KamA family protein [Dysgonomonas sp. PF1-16]MDH6382348.1 KamA family protein [Dysgonomonas sp. PFB1-18]MDH6399698.1 KamA family protein [Dysgonomonas sp. PF1-23]
MSKQIKTYALHNYLTIPQMESLSEEMKKDIEIVGRVLPFKTNNYVVDELINWDDVEHDPIFTLNFPRMGMLEKKHYLAVEKLLDQQAEKEVIDRKVREIRLALNPNPAGQEHNVPYLGEIKLKGIQHKYPETVLFFPSQGQTCHAFCTFCFRWPQFSGMSELKFAMKEADLLLKYLRVHKEVTDILFTGGDPMVMNAATLQAYIRPLLTPEFSHIHSIRIGTKSLAYWPYRYLTDADSDDIISLFEEVVAAGKNLSVQAHFNHPRELSTDAVKQAIKRILSTGAQIRTQSPLLRNINDKPELWAEMWRKQVDLGCIPYYMFIARDTGAKHYFELPLDRCWQIFRRAYRQVSGLCRTVRGPSMSDNAGKIQVLGVQEVRGEKIFVLRFIQGRNPKWVDVPFFAEYNPKATWFDQLKPAFGDERFFFEEQLLKLKVAKPFLFE